MAGNFRKFSELKRNVSRAAPPNNPLKSENRTGSEIEGGNRETAKTEKKEQFECSNTNNLLFVVVNISSCVCIHQTANLLGF